MSRMNEMWHGSLDDAKGYLEADTPDLQETQCALINAINHIQQLERKVEAMGRRLDFQSNRIADLDGDNGQ